MHNEQSDKQTIAFRKNKNTSYLIEINEFVDCRMLRATLFGIIDFLKKLTFKTICYQTMHNCCV